MLCGKASEMTPFLYFIILDRFLKKLKPQANENCLRCVNFSGVWGKGLSPPVLFLWTKRYLQNVGLQLVGSTVHITERTVPCLGPSCLMLWEKYTRWRATCKRIFLLFGESNIVPI
ncbi:hypothetical protein E2542_SST02003 [Spatholobus suberectus]|nr:hypothetical protein E2542_SST02003 [Spatholobus suberectus]